MALQSLTQWEGYFAGQSDSALRSSWMVWGRDIDGDAPAPSAAAMNAWVAVNQEMHARDML